MVNKNIKPRSYEQVAGDDPLLHHFLEGTVKTAVIPTHRFVKNGTNDGEYLLCGNGERMVGMSVEQMNVDKDTYDDYAVDARIRALNWSPMPVVLETTGTPAFRIGDDLMSNASGQAIAATSTNWVGAVALGAEFTVDGLKYVRARLVDRPTKKEA